ncbi:MlaD family protein [Nocardia aurantiaca]|uniref:MCE family protein n=1 Tax=Nocardia aurantiaca TaxID=2675850 RepID=A0A6I3L342_9NOCA|nr:MlaD family protein [Nocardia aurantiaca]MTE16722.1 MCE family protein [Nocardia aurantiaca]
MQRLSRLWTGRMRRGQFPVDHAAARAHRELRFGIVGAAVVVGILIAAGVVYVVPLGKSTYTAELAEAGSVKVGDSVRIAGVPVGAVTALDLLDDRVRMKFTVDSHVAVGDQTTLEIRMLTVAGGHYVAVQPSGTKALGSKSISVDRVSLPYSLVQTFRDAAAPIGNIDAGTLRENFTALRDALTTTPDGIRQMGTALDSIVAILQHQNADISRTLTVASEFATTLDSVKSRVGQLIGSIGEIETVTAAKRSEIRRAMVMTADLTSRLAALEPSWNTTLKPMSDAFVAALPQLQELGQRLDGVITSLSAMGQHLQSLISPTGDITVDRSATTVSLPAVCIPLPGQGC